MGLQVSPALTFTVVTDSNALWFGRGDDNAQMSPGVCSGQHKAGGGGGGGGVGGGGGGGGGGVLPDLILLSLSTVQFYRYHHSGVDRPFVDGITQADWPPSEAIDSVISGVLSTPAKWWCEA